MTPETVEGFRLSPQQSRLWALQEQDGAGAYRTRCAITIEGDADSARLREALQAVVQRHEILRTDFRRLPGMGTPLQAVREHLPIDLRERDAPGVALEHGPLLTALLQPASAGRSELLLDLPALCADRATLGRLLVELSALYGDPEAEERLGEVLQYADVAEWFHDLLEKPESASGIEYWRKIALPAEASSRLPFEGIPSGAGPFDPGSLRFFIPAQTLEGIEQLSEQLRSSPRVLLLTCWQALLHRLLGDAGLVVGYATDGRRLEELKSTMGPCARYLPLRGTLHDDPPLPLALARVESNLKEQEKWEELFTWETQRSVSEEGERIPFLPFCFEYAARSPARAGALSLRLEEEHAGIDRFKLRLSCTRSDGVLKVGLDYDANLLGLQEVQRLAARFERILESAVRHPEASVGELEILPVEEKRRLCFDLNDTRREFPDGRPIHERFEEWVERGPDEVAVVCDGRRLTYSELNERANRIAHLLKSAGAGPESLVGLCVERSIEMIVGLLAIWKAGAAYVPLDPSLPAERLGLLLEDTGTSLVLTRSALVARFEASGVRILLFDGRLDAAGTNPHATARPENLAYVIFTSGSTGRPKGVAVEHRQVANYASAIIETLDLPKGAAFATVTTLAADLGNTAIFPCLSTGGRLHVVSETRAADPEGLAEDFERDPVDYLKIVPSHLAALLSASRPERILPRRCLILGGEAASWDLIEQVRALAPSCQVVNHYGPTEATIGATTFPLPAVFTERRPRTVPIGKPLPNCRVFLLDSRGRMVPPGVPGELHIGGAGLARGYWRRPELTAEKFPIIDVEGSGERLYRTGDVARYLPDGNIDLLGRTDDQIKVHGFRIEPGEIEAALRQHPAIQEAVVLPRELPGAGRRLVAYFLVRGDETPASSDLRQFLGGKLPEFMLPSAFVRLQRIPLTANGKVDRAALPVPDPSAPGGDEPIVLPRTRAERILAKVWKDVLRVERFSIHDNFFDLGGDSILAMQIIAWAAREGLRLTPRQLFERQTVAELAEVADSSAIRDVEQGPVTGAVPLTPIQHWFFEQDLLDPHHFNQSIALEAREPLDPDALETASEALLKHHDALRLRFAREASGWRQTNAPPESGGIFSLLSLDGRDDREQEEAIVEAAARAHASLDITRGPIARVLLLDRGAGKPARLLLIVHHLAIDIVSWRVLLEDLETAYRQIRAGGVPALPPKTSSFRDWGEKLAEIAASGSLERETGYWLFRNDASTATPPPDFGGENTVGSERIIESVFSEKETRELLTEVPSVYRTQINDALLAGLAEALARPMSSRSVWIGLEGHGREEVVPGIDLSRTVGWFTARFPVLLELPETAGIAERLILVKEQLRRIPQRGVGYGVLRYLAGGDASNRLKSIPEPTVSFNYLGQVDQLLPEDSLWRVVPSLGPPRSARNRRRYLLSVEGRVVRGRLLFSWIYSENLHRRATIERLAEGFEQALRALIAHCRSPEAGRYRPSDFPKARLSQKDFDKLVAKLKPAQQEVSR